VLAYAVAWLAFLQGPDIVTVCPSTRESSTCPQLQTARCVLPAMHWCLSFRLLAQRIWGVSASPDLLRLPLVFFLFLQPPQLPTRPGRRLCCMAPLSVCVRPTTCCWATSASTGPPTCLQAQCPTHCPSPTGVAAAADAGEWTALMG
jgi:hypothetical protein